MTRTPDEWRALAAELDDPFVPSWAEQRMALPAPTFTSDDSGTPTATVADPDRWTVGPRTTQQLRNWQAPLRVTLVADDDAEPWHIWHFSPVTATTTTPRTYEDQTGIYHRTMWSQWAKARGQIRTDDRPGDINLTP